MSLISISGQSITRGWNEGDAFQFGYKKVESHKTDNNGELTISSTKIDGNVYEKIVEINEVTQRVNISSIYQHEEVYLNRKYNATDMGQTIANQISGTFYLENTTNDLIMTDFTNGLNIYSFVEPNWAVLNTEIKNSLTRSNKVSTMTNLSASIDDSQYRTINLTWDLFFDSIGSFKIMGKNNLDDGLNKITDSSHSWKFEFDLTPIARSLDNKTNQYLIMYDSYFISIELEYHENGILKYSKFTKDSKITNGNLIYTNIVVIEKYGGLRVASGINGFGIIPTIILLCLILLIARKQRF
ncbi:MAG: hypothetical protein ACXAC7_13650 [Candidatus Hodarchaeales archaeon]